MAGSERKLTVVIAGDAKGAVGALGSIDKATGDTGSRLDSVGKKAGLAFAAIGGAALIGGKQAIDAASNLNETLSKSNTIFGEAGKAMEHWAGRASKAFGQSKQQALEAAGTFGNMFTQLGIGQIEASAMSRNMTELASDFASFHNADITEVLSAQTAAFRGEFDAVQRFVPTINAAAVEQKALAMTGKATTKELTAQEKALATQALLMEGAGAATGDFARTADGLANKQRTMSAQFEDIKAKIGNALIPIMLTLTDVVMKIIDYLSEHEGVLIALGVIVGTTLVVAFTAWAVSAAAAAASTIAAAAPVLAIIGLIAALAAGVIYAYTHWGWFKDAVDAVARFFTDTLWPALQRVASFIADNVIPVIARVIQVFIDWHVKAAEIIAGIIGVFVDLVTWVTGLPGKLADAAGDLWGWMANGLDSILDGVLGAFEWAINKAIDLINIAIGAYNAIPLVDNIDKVDHVDLNKRDFKSTGGGAARWGWSGAKKHGGGIFRAGSPGGEGFALLRDRERVLTPNSTMGGAGNVIHVSFAGAIIASDRDAERWVVEALNRATAKGIR